MTKDDFYNNLETAITIGCQLPFTVPEKALDNIVNYAYKWFTRNWDDALENVYISLPFEHWSATTEFQNTRHIQLPNCVFSIESCAKNQSSNRTRGVADFSVDKFMYSNWGVDGGFGVAGGNQSDAVLGYVIANSWGDLVDHIMNYPISHSYNRNTNKLFIKGDISSSPDLLLDCQIAIPKEAIYELDLFYNYCLGYAKMDLSNIMGTFSFNLPGGGEINIDRYYDQGKELVDEVKEEVKSMRGGSDFIFTTGGR